MDYEKKYKEALEWVRDLYPTMEGAVKEDAEHYFPELKESEDERIRKAIINVFASHKDYENFHGASVEDILAWLEKQGEHKQWVHVDPISEEDKLHLMFDGQKPADKVEPRFHEGDWVVVSTTKGDKVVQIASIEYFKNGYPSYITTEGRWFGNGIKARLLTNKDVETTTIPESRINVSKNKSWSEEDEQNLNAALSYINDEHLRRWLKDNIYNKYEKPTWSEEDEQLIDEVAVCLRKYAEKVQGGYSKFYVQSLADRIESLRPGNTCKATEWSEEDEAMFQGVIETEQYMLDVVYGRKIFAVGNEDLKEECTKELAWLKSLKDRIK